MSDEKIMLLFKNGQRDKAFKELYKLYPRIEKLILSKGGTKTDANDVFQEALIILNRNLEKLDFKLTSSFYTYLYSVSRFVWKDTQKQFSKQELHNLQGEEVSILDAVLEEQKYQSAERAFRELGERCQRLLQRFYLKKMSFKAIAVAMQFKSEKAAKNQKYKCLQKAKDIYRNQFKTLQS
ncbi:RNA polymerase sigma factor [Winogradskyella psychrotolerans]|uniref:RNA polymerase sigma factor n=1 Tax=Winogradskyella psychrotolerans TaxID=1344585 RepID=UPI001C06D85C|nr:sigma-70 family RNA polymerase sigma factor [Winogradskyella psychrotolerans]MBU2926882.1 sigma-70 family RNA polymerase sigma factor [Winogradskyella psychrotolerans]